LVGKINVNVIRDFSYESYLLRTKVDEFLQVGESYGFIPRKALVECQISTKGRIGKQLMRLKLRIDSTHSMTHQACENKW
jgi:hypothetical protein